MTEEQRKEGILKRYKDLPKGVVTYIDFLIIKINKLVSESKRKQTQIPQWHDLRKDPNDLPKKNGDYWVYMNCCGNKITRALVWENGVFCNMYDATIIAWCEIPQFKE